MPILLHKESNKRVFFIHIPRTAGRFIYENLLLNGFVTEHENDMEVIDGKELGHFHKKLYEKHLNVENILHFAVVRNPIDRFYSGSGYLKIKKGYPPIVYPKLGDFKVESGIYWKNTLEEDLKDYDKFLNMINNFINVTHNNWFRPQYEFLSTNTEIWRFENNFGQSFFDWLGSLLNIKLIKYDVVTKVLPWEIEQITKNSVIDNNIKKFYERDYDI